MGYGSHLCRGHEMDNLDTARPVSGQYLPKTKGGATADEGNQGSSPARQTRSMCLYGAEAAHLRGVARFFCCPQQGEQGWGLEQHLIL